MAWLLGLLHDVGKASCAWQEGLLHAEADGGRVGIDHKSLGAQLAADRGLGGFALAIEGHHGGLTSPRELRRRLKALDKAALARNSEAERVIRGLLPELSPAASVAIPDEWIHEPLVGEMAVRLAFSALCDADFLDTSAHFTDSAKPAVRDDADFRMLFARFEQRRKKELDDRSRSSIDSIRDDVYDACVKAAEAEPGFFRLAAPTGSGKTLSSGAFALRHAALHGHRRVIVAVPFLTITEQNAAVYRSMLDADGEDPTVLEHHSQVNLDSDDINNRWWRLAAENWDVPFVVTTTVRLFEALFDRKPAAMRRIHRLAGAVIVLDEVQALPHRLLIPILDALRVLVAHFGTTVVLSSATQPELWELSPFRDLPDAREIVTERAVVADQLRRVRFEWRTNPSPTLDEVAQDTVSRQQALVVLNTTADAARLYQSWRTDAPENVAWHLSTRMCPAHRRRVLDMVRARLLNGEPTLLVSTQLIEAGVDVDFPVVYRAMAPADSLLQAAGRANREGNLPGLGQVILIDPSDGGQPPSYRTLVNVTRTCFGPGRADPDDINALGNYYRSIYEALGLEHRDHVGQRIQAARRRLDFHTVTDGPADPVTGIRDRRYAFRMILDEGISVITPQGAANSDTRSRIEDLTEQVRSATGPGMSALRDLQPYITSVHQSALRRPGVLALLKPVLGDPTTPGGLAEWIGDYDDNTGITLDPNLEDYVL
ncbi:CRISPR-associated helicase/endonuclease Cas3 [Actinophytocola sediminis]